MDKAPDAFEPSARSPPISTSPARAAIWETRFTQIKPMKRGAAAGAIIARTMSTCPGIRRLLYGEGYTIRGVQRILKEHGIASVQRKADATAVASFGAIEEAVGRSLSEQDGEEAAPGIDLDDDDYESADGIDFRLLEPDEEDIEDAGPIPGVAGTRPLDVARLQNVLQDLLVCRQLLETALKDG